jgi:hypothetical protein
VLLVAEHGEYPKSDTGQTVYPKRRLFDAIADVVRQRGSAKPVPLFVDNGEVIRVDTRSGEYVSRVKD